MLRAQDQESGALLPAEKEGVLAELESQDELGSDVVRKESGLDKVSGAKGGSQADYEEGSEKKVDAIVPLGEMVGGTELVPLAKKVGGTELVPLAESVGGTELVNGTREADAVVPDGIQEGTIGKRNGLASGHGNFQVRIELYRFLCYLTSFVCSVLLTWAEILLQIGRPFEKTDSVVKHGGCEGCRILPSTLDVL